jgi:predicted MFS family arabinose efflux permease
LMAAAPAGSSVGTYLFVRFVSPDARSRWIGPLAVLTGIPFILCAMRPSLTISLALWAIAGTAMAYQVQVMSSFVLAVPPERRGQAIGIGASGLLAVQGIGSLLGGVVANSWSASGAIGLAGGFEVCAAILLVTIRNRLGVRPARTPAHRART